MDDLQSLHTPCVWGFCSIWAYPIMNNDGQPRTKGGNPNWVKGMKRPARTNPPNPATKGIPKQTLTIAAMVKKALDMEGGVDYLRKIARDQPRLFVPLLARVMPVEAIVQAANVQFVVQSYHIEGGAVPGVLASPVAAHVAPQRSHEDTAPLPYVQEVIQIDADTPADSEDLAIAADCAGVDELDRM